MSREIIIGDIHGCYDEMLELLDIIKPASEDQIIAVGDIVDRGPKSVELYHYFKNTPNARIIMGNHERKHLRGIMSYSQEIVRLQFGDLYPEFVAWLENIAYYYESEHAIVVHAGLEDGVPLEQQRENVLSGTMGGSKYLARLYQGRYWSEVYSGEKPVIYGHHVVGPTPEILNGKIYGIDTGACHGGRLTALVLPGFEVHQVQVKKDYWSEQMSIWQLPVLKHKDWDNFRFSEIRQEIQKLKKKHRHVRQFAEALEVWLEQFEELTMSIETTIQEQTQSLIRESGSTFKEAVSQLPQRNLLHLAYHERLTTEEIANRYKTPASLRKLGEMLEMDTDEIPGQFQYDEQVRTTG